MAQVNTLSTPLQNKHQVKQPPSQVLRNQWKFNYIGQERIAAVFLRSQATMRVSYLDADKLYREQCHGYYKQKQAGMSKWLYKISLTLRKFQWVNI